MTTPLTDGTQVSPQRYLADTDAAAAAVAAFTRGLAGVGPVATPAALERAAPGLRDSLADAEALSARLTAERLEDSRLETQREQAAGALAGVVTAMRLAAGEAAAGRPTRFVLAVDAYSNAVASLRAAGRAD